MQLLSRDYDIKDICELMGVSRSGYYKWKNRKKSERDIKREELIALVDLVHADHKTHGYRWTAAFIRLEYGYKCSDNYVYKCFRFLGIKSETKHQVHYRKRKEKDKFPNLIFTTWETVDRPRQVIVSDMTAFKFWYFYFEVTFYFDVFTKEILTYRVGARKGDRNQYIDGLEDVKSLLKGQKEPVVLHTDQGSVYASMAYNEIIKDTVIVRSMSRAGKPTDNPVNESINGWMKEELYMDFKIDECKSRDEFITTLDKYVNFYNKHRPCYAIGYDTPENYRKRFFKGEIEKKNTFEKRVLSEEPKFVQKRRKQAHSGDVSTFEKEKA
ncbi:MAG: IS3 family transposase [Methanobrevibacter sp.]|nr:IS3 family transposase [Methanobrevibacter sp.]